VTREGTRYDKATATLTPTVTIASRHDLFSTKNNCSSYWNLICQLFMCSDLVCCTSAYPHLPHRRFFCLVPSSFSFHFHAFVHRILSVAATKPLEIPASNFFGRKLFQRGAVAAVTAALTKIDFSSTIKALELAYTALFEYTSS
jgi:hypothetical protein